MSLRDQIVRGGGLPSYLSAWARSNFKPLWDLLQSIPVFKDVMNQFYICAMLNKFTSSAPRISHFTLKHDLPTMEGMYDESRTTYSRLLPRAPEFTRSLPPVDAAASLFSRDIFTPESNCNLSLLLSYYAQWFTHQFFNTCRDNPIYTNQPVGINLSQLYGSTPEMEKSLRSYSDGLLKTSIRNGEEFPEIYEVDGVEMFRMPIQLANLIPGFASIHILFFRRHQHVAREIARDAANRGCPMSDEEIFQKAKIIVAINVLRLTMHDYVARSLQSSYAKIRFDMGVKKSIPWKLMGPRPYHVVNAIQIEFNFLYRWHHLYPDVIKTVKSLPLGDEAAMGALDQTDISKHDTEVLKFPSPEKRGLSGKWNSVQALCGSDGGLERTLFSASCSRAGKLELLNVNEWLVKNVIEPGLRKCRQYELASYNDYREHFGFGRVKTFEQISSDPRIVSKLKEVYAGDVDKIEYYPGIFAEDKDHGGVHGPFLATIGVGMTYSGIFASRLFENDLVNEELIGTRGLELANEINYMQDMTSRHTRLGDARIRFTMADGLSLEAGQ